MKTKGDTINIRNTTTKTRTAPISSRGSNAPIFIYLNKIANTIIDIKNIPVYCSIDKVAPVFPSEFSTLYKIEVSKRRTPMIEKEPP